jgi:homoserine kinase
VEAHRQDGHGENAAACLHGGLCAVVHYLNNPVIVPLNLSSRVGFAYAAPLEGLSTRKARRVLPKEVGHDVAVRSLGRATALVQGFALGDPELIRIGVEDELHVPYRLPLIDSAEEAIAAGYEAGAWAVTISGAGSGIIAMCDLENTEAVSDAMCIVLSLAVGESNCLGFSPAPDHEGLTRLS